MTVTGSDPQGTVPPYATGGGGTVLEHRYGATLLAHLLCGDPVPALGDDAAPTSVTFQASSFSPVDDLVVIGRTRDGLGRRISIGVRRSPSLVVSDEPSIHLLASYVRVLADYWDEVRVGRWRLGLAVASPKTAVQQLEELCVIARGTADAAAFRAEVARPGRTNQSVRDRLGHVDALVRAAGAGAGLSPDLDPGLLTWRLLSGLHVSKLRLEGADETDRTAAVTRLRTVARDGTPAAADLLFSKLAELAGRYAPTGAQVTEGMLRRDLSGTALGRSPSHGQAWEVLDRLASRLRDRTRFELTDPTSHLELQRTGARQALATEMTAAASVTTTLLVHGEPDVGKSALTLRAAENMESGGAVVTVLSLRDLPGTTGQLDALLGGDVAAVLAATATGPGRLLVIDGAEAVLEGRGPLLTDVATAALRAGLGVVAVSRRDGATAVTEALNHASRSAGAQGPPRQLEVSGLTAEESQQVVTVFGSLARLPGEPRAAWLLARPGLLDPLLRAGAAIDLPQGPLSEAEVFDVLWRHLVRRNERHEPGTASPDARDRTMVSLARRLLLSGDQGEPPDVSALPSLRSDGLLLPLRPTSAWSAGDEFASDLIRDLAVARLLITDGWGLLEVAGAPRWALRAVRLACQARLAASGPNIEAIRAELQATFDDLATRRGARWAEVPLEAMLTLGLAQAALGAAWPALLADDRRGLRTLVRLALQRYSQYGFGDAEVLAAIVALAYCGYDNLGQDDRYSRGDTGEQIREVVLAWLRGLVKANAGPSPLRQRVRDRILAGQPRAYDEFAVEALAMLGPDLDERADGFLRALAEEGGGHLAASVESVGPILAMSTHQPELLIDLSEAFYIERHDPDDPYGWSHSPLDEGIRHHEKAGGVGVPMAAWYFGPFFRLLNMRPNETVAMINRMLDHAAAVRVGRTDPWEPPSGAPESDLPGLDLDLPGVGARRCVGDSHVWCWYRGSSVGPYPCMSALLAVERFADHLVDTLGLPLAAVTKLLLRDCHNLAMPGLVVGLLIRHLDSVGDLLDPWLTMPELWHLEISRVIAEGQLHVQGADPPDLVGRDNRRLSLREAGAQMTLRAMLAGDAERLAALGANADELVRRARDLMSGRPGEAEELATVEGWAAALRPESYRAREAEGGGVLIQYEHPPEVASVLAPSLASLARGNEAWRLQATYAVSEDRVAPVDTLIDDIRVARGLADQPPENGPLYAMDPVAAVAAAAIVAHAQGRSSVPPDDIRWAADVLVNAAPTPLLDPMSYDGTIFPMGADRSAAAALPALLLPPFHGTDIDTRSIEEALRRCATSVFDEVRAALAVGLAPVWAMPCHRPSGSTTCLHEVAWATVQDGLRDCRLGDWNQQAQRRLPDPLDGPYDQTLPVVDTERLLLNRLVPPLVAAADAARSQACVAGAARRLLDVLFDAHRRASDHWATKGYGGYGLFRDRQRPVVRVLVELAIGGEIGPLTDYVRAFASNARALDQLLRDVAVLFTYDVAVRGALTVVWRTVMTAALDAMDAGADFLNDRHWSDSAIAGLLPTPQLDISDTDPDTTLERARQSWLSPDDIADLVARWLQIARREPRALDAVAQLARCVSPAWQATTGLAWAEDLVGGDYVAVASRCWFFIDWLGSVRASGQLQADGWARWRRLVDGLAAEGDARAAGLQQAEE
jgi:hypothetical protein